MRTVLIGGRGQLGADLRDCLRGEVVVLGHDDIEVAEPRSVETALDEAGPARVVNLAAWNLVDRAEDEPAAAYAVNALGARNVALWCGSRDVPLLHVSTDYVFGLDRERDTPYAETDAPGPLSVYGVSKLAGEYHVRSLARRHFVVRTCGLYGRQGAGGKGNFVETMLRLAGQGSQIRVVNDQRCTPTYTVDLARALADLLETEAWGLYHATNAGATTWYEFAREIFRHAAIDAAVRPVTSEELGANARRPAYSVLDNGKLASVLGWALPPWDEALKRYLAERP